MVGKVLMIHMDYPGEPKFYDSLDQLKEENRWTNDVTEEVCSDDELFDYLAEWVDIYVITDDCDIMKLTSLSD